MKNHITLAQATAKGLITGSADDGEYLAIAFEDDYLLIRDSHGYNGRKRMAVSSPAVSN